MLVVRSIAMLATYHLLYHVSHFSHVSPNHPFLANRCLAMLPLLLIPLIALLVAGEDEVCSLLEHGDVVPCWNMFTCWDITIYLI